MLISRRKNRENSFVLPCLYCWWWKLNLVVETSSWIILLWFYVSSFKAFSSNIYCISKFVLISLFSSSKKQYQTYVFKSIKHNPLPVRAKIRLATVIVMFKRLAWRSGTARRWQILRDGFDSWVELIAFDNTVKRVAANSKNVSSLRSLPQLLLNFQFNVIWK